jgi:hypothetical protein
MENVRLFLWLTLAGALWLGYSAWLTDYAPPVVAGAPAVTGVAPAPDAPPALPSIDPAGTPAAVEPPVTRSSGELVRVRTDVLDVLIDSIEDLRIEDRDG